MNVNNVCVRACVFPRYSALLEKESEAMRKRSALFVAELNRQRAEGRGAALVHRGPMSVELKEATRHSIASQKKGMRGSIHFAPGTTEVTAEGGGGGLVGKSVRGGIGVLFGSFGGNGGFGGDVGGSGDGSDNSTAGEAVGGGMAAALLVGSAGLRRWYHHTAKVNYKLTTTL